MANTAQRGDLCEKILLFSFVALSPIQDLVLRQSFLRGMGGYPSVFPLLAMLALSFVVWLRRGQFIVNKLGFWCAIYAFLTTVAGFFWFGTSSQGENLVWRVLTNVISLGLFLGAIFVPKYAAYPRTVRAGCATAFIILVLGVLFCHPSPLGLPEIFENSVFHTPLLYPTDPRVRGFCSEPSIFAPTAIAVCLLCAYLSGSRFRKAFFVISAFGLLGISQSKGGIMVLFICTALLLMLRFRRWYQIPILVLSSVPLGLLAMTWLSGFMPEEGLLVMGSVQDRTAMIVSGIETIAHYPFGVGFSGFVPAMRFFIPDAMEIVQAQSPFPLPFIEPIEDLSNSYDLSTHTTLFDQTVRFGIPFAILFILLSWRLLKRLNHNRETVLFIAVLASLISISTYVPLQYASSILLGVALTVRFTSKSGGSGFRSSS